MPPLPHQKPTTPPPSSSTPPRPSTPPPSFCPPSPPVSFDASPRVRPFPVPEVDKISPQVKKTAPGMRIQEPELRTEKYQTVRLKSLDQLRYYLSTNSLRTALESAPHWQLSFHPIPDSVSGPLLKALSDRPYIRLDYNPISSTLRLWMASPLHDCMQGWASDMMTLINDYLLIRAPDQRLRALVSKHRLAVSLYSPPDGPDTAYLPPTTISRKRKAPVDPLQPRKKPAAIHKSPDYSWTLHGVKYPLVVFEAAWTETPQDLDDDAEQWLIKTSGGTRVVVTILFVEKDSPYKLRKRELRERYSQLQAQQEAEEDDHEGVEPPSSPLSTAPSTASDHHAERAAINADEWVGSITTHITLWRYKGSSCTGQRLCDGKVTIYPNGSTRISTPPPRIYLKDVYDKKAGGDDDEEDRVFEFNWAALHKELQVGRVDYALERKLNAVKKIRQEFGL